MTDPDEDADDADTPPRRVRVPNRRGDSVFDPPEYAEVDEDAAGQWDARRWRSHPLR